MSAQLESHEVAAGWQPRHNPTLSPAGTGRAQFLHALLILALPPAGTVLAVALAWRWGLGWSDLLMLAAMYVLTIIGITVGFHRGLTHRAFQAGPATRAVLTVLGAMAAQGPPIYWVSNHRRHHHFSDRPGDPHSPLYDEERRLGRWRGLWHAHVAWTFRHRLSNTVVFAKDLIADPLVSRLNRLYFVWVLLGFGLPALAGGLLSGSWRGALTGLLWGGFVRLFLTYHATHSINSITHLFGSRPFNTREQSRNNAWLVLPTGGEAWHNNHHAFPGSAVFGLRWWQLDPGGWVVRGLARLRLIHDVRLTTPEMIAARLAQQPPAGEDLPERETDDALHREPAHKRSARSPPAPARQGETRP
ncbi:fatty acid desaturase [Aquabacterium sp. A7-Y]|uniref:acyl-CoA desaturase n=1 Tax=Aquabacterium sp. A7-Y TaxID=1349605 RepID=UPI00223E5E3F|nr:fatty acid desaturase [Aquabacterium sp. A7-Y]MCW7539726.1 fatty acid desaturase [Aquabacterium sp. A7-Y]